MADYAFPNSNVFVDLVDRLRTIDAHRLARMVADRKPDMASSKRPLSEIRDTFCAMSIVLNEQGLIPPEFRRFRRLGKYTGLTNEDKNHSNDCRIIDLHHIFCTHNGQFEPIENEFKGLLSGDSFDFELASQYVSVGNKNSRLAKGWRSGTITDRSLKLPDNIQIELAVIHNKKIRKQKYKVSEKIPEVELKLRRRVSTPSSRLEAEHIDKYLNIFKCLMLANGSPSRAAEYLLMMNGDDRSFISANQREAMRKKKVWFESDLKISGW